MAKKKSVKNDPRKMVNIALDFDNIVDDCEKDMGMDCISLERGAYIKHAISTGSLTLDLIVGGGWTPGRWITLSGKEQSGKSTLSYFALKYALETDIPTFFLDHEGSTESAYLEKILGLPLADIQGLRNEKGQWVKKPMIRYYSPDIGEDTFRFIKRILRKLPNKIKDGDQWYLVYKNSKKNKSRFKKEKDKECIYNEKLKKRTNKYWIPCKDGSAQALFFIDSLASMTPEARAEDDKSNPMAKVARMFSECFPLVKPILRQKRVTIVATNHVKQNPMQKYGDPTYEVGGEAPLNNADARVRLTTRANPNDGKTGQIEEEASIDGTGIDRYRYIHLKTIKNKMFSPFREAFLRIWFEESGEPGRGIDPVWDCFQFLKLTGQISKSRGNYLLSLPGIWENKKITWPDFKEVVLNPPDLNRIELYKSYKLKDNQVQDLRKQRKDKKKEEKVKIDAQIIKILTDLLDIRQICKDQLKDSTAFKLYFDTIGGKKKEETGKESLDIDNDNNDEEDDE